MTEPKRNYESTVEEKKKYAEYLLLEAAKTGDNSLAWKLVDFLIDTRLLDELK